MSRERLIKVNKMPADDSCRYTKELPLRAYPYWENTFDNFPDIITIHDKNFNIIRANKAAREVIKLPSADFNKAPLKCYEYYHAKDHPPDACPSCECLKTGNTVSIELFEPCLGGFFEIRAMPLFDGDNNLTGVMHIARDITEQLLSRGQNRLQLNRLNILHSIEKIINSTLDLRIMLEHIVEQIITYLGIDAVSILLHRQKISTLDYFVSSGFRSRALKHTHLKLGESYAGQAAVKHRTIHVRNLREDNGKFKKSKLFMEEEFVTYFAVPLITKGEIKGVLECFHRSPYDADPELMDFLETVADQAAIAIHNATLFESLFRSNAELSLAYDNTIESWARILDMRDKETEGHSRRVTEITMRIAQEIGIDDSELVHIRRGALLHDIGKMAIPDSILLKPGRLTFEEREVMKFHTTYAFDMIYNIDYLRPAVDIPHYHHEKWDGTGYPKGLAGYEIPLPARIFAVVDVYDALCFERPYRSAWPREKAIEYIRLQAGIHFDPEVVKVFLKLIDKLL